ncbi:MAG TPA: vitamin K epoxide reductase family protein, partial [Candidatus Saccharimonadales bacterium]
MRIFGQSITLVKALPWILIIGGVIGIVSSAVLTHDELQLAKNPAYTPGCDLNPVVSCGSVTQSEQAHVFGFPNPFLGLAGYAVTVT